jgi:hypothetical protein
VRINYGDSKYWECSELMTILQSFLSVNGLFIKGSRQTFVYVVNKHFPLAWKEINFVLIQILLYIQTVEWSTGLVSISIFYLSNYFYLPIFLLSIIFIRFVLPNACIICVCLRPSPLIRLLCFYLLALHALYYSFYFTITTWTVNFVKILKFFFWAF